MDTNTVFAKVYLTTQTLLRTLVTELMESMEDFGCGAWSDRDLFAKNIRKVMLKLANCSEHEAPLATFELPGASTRDKRLALIKEVLIGFGASESAATPIANLALSGNVEMLGRLDSRGRLVLRRPKVFCLLRMRLAHLHADSMKLHERLKEVLVATKEPYRGTAMNPDAGVEQVVELMQRFPDLSDAIYAKLGFRSTTSFPPEATGIAGSAERIFVKAANAQVDSEWWWNTFKVAGLIIASITITVITAGTLGPLAATFVGSGIGLSQGVAGVVDASNKLQHTQDAHRFGAATQESVEYAEGEVQGAWGVLIVDTATGGMLGRFGGGPAVSNAMKVLRVSAISGVGNGLATATNPNVWKSENTAGLIIFATVVGGVSGAGGHFVASGITRVIPQLGAKIQIGVSKLDGHLDQGATVKVQLRPNEAAISAKVVAVNRADSTVMLKIDGKNLHVRVGKVVKLQGSVFQDEAVNDVMRPMTDSDFNPLYTKVYRVKPGSKPGAEPEMGLVERQHDGSIIFTSTDHSTTKVKLDELRILEEAPYVPKVAPQGMSKKDFELFGDHSSTYQIAPLKTQPDYYSVVRKQGNCNHQPKLRIVPGHKADHSEAFDNWHWEGLPKFQIRTRGRGRKFVQPSPEPDEIALFMAHGSTRGFTSMSTRKAARTVVDAIVDTNRKATTKTPVRFCALSSCAQGNRRYFVMGKTNAQVFQKQVDMRLLELGINPKSAKGITVLASDRMGSISGADNITTFFRKRVKTTFVPAGTQRPLSYPRDIANEGIKIVGLALLSATGGVVIIAADDPDAFLDAIERFSDYILGVIVDSPAEETSKPVYSPSQPRGW